MPPNSERKRNKQKAGAANGGGDPQAGAASGSDADPSTSGRKWTLSLAVPGSLLDPPGSSESAGYLAAQIARAAVNFQVDEVVVYDDSPAAAAAASSAHASVSAGTALLAQLLQFLETPPHLRPNLLDGAHPGFRLASALPPLAAPHHVRGGLGGRGSAADGWVPYREGVVLKSEPGSGSYVDVGLDRMVLAEQELPPRTRVTVHIGGAGSEVTRFMPAYSETMICGQLVAPSLPRERLGLYWGYVVRIALGLPRCFKDSPFSKAGYDLTIGSSPQGAATDPTRLVLPKFRHALVVFGSGEEDIEALLGRDPDWAAKAPQDVFNLYLNTSPHLGALKLRTEDAVPIALSYLVTPLLKYGRR